MYLHVVEGCTIRFRVSSSVVGTRERTCSVNGSRINSNGIHKTLFRCTLMYGRPEVCVAFLPRETCL
jgi:hypothetical protein